MAPDRYAVWKGSSGGAAGRERVRRPRVQRFSCSMKGTISCRCREESRPTTRSLSSYLFLEGVRGGRGEEEAAMGSRGEGESERNTPSLLPEVTQRNKKGGKTDNLS